MSDPIVPQTDRNPKRKRKLTRYERIQNAVILAENERLEKLAKINLRIQPQTPAPANPSTEPSGK